MVEWHRKLAKWCAAPMGGEQARRVCLIHDPGTVSAALAYAVHQAADRVLVIATDTNTAEMLAGTLETFLEVIGDPRDVLLVPEVTTTRRGQWLPENEAARCAALEKALGDVPMVFVAPVMALMTPALAPDRFADHIFTLRVGDSGITPEELAVRLVRLDYDNEFEVHVPGEFARRGGIVDIYSPVHDAPVRIEFFGDTIESMRFFIPDTQRSFRETEEVRVVPRGAIVVGDGGDGDADVADTTVWDYLGMDVPVAVCDGAAVTEHLERFSGEGMCQAWADRLERAVRVLELCHEFAENVRGKEGVEGVPVRLDCISLGGDLGPLLPELGEGAVVWHWQQLREHLLRWLGEGYELVACCGGDAEKQRLRELLDEDPTVKDLAIDLSTRSLDVGVLFPSVRIALLSEKELFGRRPTPRRRRKQAYRLDHALRDGMDLEEGRHAVHATHGICLYHGIRQIEMSGELQDVMELEFDEDARLYVPLDQAHLVSRYVGGSKRVPKLSRMGGVSWKNAKASAAAATHDLAAELLRVEAARKKGEGFVFSPSIDWEATFAGSFPYTETGDQTQAIEEVLGDMEVSEPMDRLVCGDVGYGKTEVAMRGAFRAVLNGKQVAVLVPTTVLAQQHFVTFRERMAEYPLEIEMISRFRTKGEQKHILERLAEGKIDVVVGTHRLLQKDVAFSDLGLVIVDEEQRFGVKHKERFKELRASVDVLTMTATPIPRTLYMSLSGIRHLSTIMTAPEERLPVTTVVAAHDWDLIRQVVLRELERHGQVYFLHNRVQTIDRVLASLINLIPEARFAVGHGQMPAGELERVMSDFMGGKVDVLVCTTIIESGLDIPNANTIIIDRADRFGLAELYQLRGRVGRYHRQAYAYLLLPPMGALPQNAKQRLSAIRRYTHLGAGFKLALRDLEIRGAGNILGSEQSGHIAAVGFELYCSLLKEAVERLAHLEETRVRSVAVNLDTLVFGRTHDSGKASASIPKDYVGAENVRLECYRKLTDLESISALEAFESELVDRFGPVPKVVGNLLAVARVRVLARQVGVTSVTIRDQVALLERPPQLVKAAGGRLPRVKAVRAEGQLAELVTMLEKLS